MDDVPFPWVLSMTIPTAIRLRTGPKFTYRTAIKMYLPGVADEVLAI